MNEDGNLYDVVWQVDYLSKDGTWGFAGCALSEEAAYDFVVRLRKAKSFSADTFTVTRILKEIIYTGNGEFYDIAHVNCCCEPCLEKSDEVGWKCNEYDDW